MLGLQRIPEGLDVFFDLCDRVIRDAIVPIMTSL